MVDRPVSPVTLTSDEVNQCIRDAHVSALIPPDRLLDVFLPDPLTGQGLVDLEAFERCAGQLRQGKADARLQASTAQDALAESRLDSQLLRALSNEGAGGKLDANDIGLLRDAFQARRIQLVGYREPMSDIELRGAVKEAIAVREKGGLLTARKAREIAAHSWTHDPKRLAEARELAADLAARDLARRKANAEKAAAAHAALEARYGADVAGAQRLLGTDLRLPSHAQELLDIPSSDPQTRYIFLQELNAAHRAKPLNDTQMNSATMAFHRTIAGKSPPNEAEARVVAQRVIASARRNLDITVSPFDGNDSPAGAPRGGLHPDITVDPWKEDKKPKKP